MSELKSNNHWNNDISATYKIKKSYNAKLDIETIAEKMADGISIGTTQVAEGIYTPKTSATHIKTNGFIPGRMRADVENLKVSEDKLTEVATRLSAAEATWEMAENLYRQLADQVREHAYDIKDLNR